MRRVLVTGLGVIAPNGIGVGPFWEACLAGRGGVEPLTGFPHAVVPEIRSFDPARLRSRVVGEVKGFDAREHGLDERDASRMDRYVQFAIAAARMAVADAGLDAGGFSAERAGVCVANAICGTKYMEEEFVRVTDFGAGPIAPGLARPGLFHSASFSTPGIEIATRHGFAGPVAALSTGCTAGSDAIGYAFEAIREGDADLFLCGAAEAPLSPITIAAFDVIHALSERNEDPARASRPFDRGRDGFVLAEGAGLLLLEEAEHARRRGARAYAEVAGFGSTNNAYHMTDLAPDGEDLARAIRMALDDAKTGADEVDYISAHGSSTPQNDICETNAVKRALGKHARRVAMSSLKGMCGHPLAAANAIELVAAALTLRDGIFPPTINYEEPDPECDLDYVPNRAREGRVGALLKLSSGFSGIHSAVVMRRAPW